MSRYSTLYTSQSSPISPNQVKNSAGGFVYQISKFARLERFLILGSDSNTYYASAQKLTRENATIVTECWTENHSKTSKIICHISEGGLASKNSPAIFALALGMIHPDTKVRSTASAAVQHVCRTSTHLFEFVDTCRSIGKGFGPTLKRAVADWYNSKSDDELAYQLIKYRQRNNYTHERLLRLSHPKAENTSLARAAMYDWLRGREANILELPSKIVAHQSAVAKVEGDPLHIVNLCEMIEKENLPWEALPTWANTQSEIWQVMLAKMPLTALIRNLGNMTRLGVFDDPTSYRDIAISKLLDEEQLKKARIHPFNLLYAFKTYSSGEGFRGRNSWTPLLAINRALERAFYKSFAFVPSTGKRFLIAMDISPSMSQELMNSNMTCREAAAAMAMTTIASEPRENVDVVAFSSFLAHNMNDGKYGGAIMPINDRITKGTSLSSIFSYIKDLPFSGTDCALPMLYALEEKKEIDCFVVYTDNETWAGRAHPVEALREYREKMGIDAKLVVVAFTATGFSIADPDDPGMLDIVGFDASAPSIISSFLNFSNPLIENSNRLLTEQQEEEIPA